MDFDEYEYLEKTVELTDNGSSKKDNDVIEKEKLDKGYRRRHRDENDDERDHRKSSSKKSRSDDYDEENGRGKDRDRHRERDRVRSSRDTSRERGKSRDRSRERGKSRDRSRERGKSRDRSRERGKSRDRSRERGKSRDRSLERGKSRDRSRERGKSSDRRREMSRDRSLERGKLSDRRREKSREGSLDRGKSRDRSRERRDRDKEKEREIERERRDREKSRERERERERRSRSRSRHDRELLREREREFELRESRRYKDKKEILEPEADPERDQRTVFAYQMPLKATERDVYEFFSKAGKVRDVRLIMDRNSRRSKGVGYIEFYDVLSVPMAIAMCGQLLLGQPVMVKPSEAEKNLVQTNASGGSSVVGPYGATDRKLYVGNLHFNMTELQLRQVFEPFGPVELVQLPLDPETGHCKGFGFVQFAQLEHAKAAQILNGTLELAGRTIKVSSVTDHIGLLDSGAKTADFDDDEGGGLSLNAQSRALLMQKLDRSGIASSVVGSIGVPALNGAATSHLTTIAGTTAIPAPFLTQQVLTSMAPEPIGNPSECLLLKNMFDPATETDPEFDLDIKDDVYEECSKYGHVKHIHVDKNSAGYVYLRFDTVEGASGAQQAMHKRWFARRLISAIYLQPYEYDAKFKGAA